ncbi:MAG: hypothetical protein AAGE89_01270 [Pseudomonadota bacterium]
MVPNQQIRMHLAIAAYADHRKSDAQIRTQPFETSEAAAFSDNRHAAAEIIDGIL